MVHTRNARTDQAVRRKLHRDLNAYPIDARGVAYNLAFSSVKHLGEGQFYLMTILDSDGQPFDGARPIT